ncbi:MAG: AMP-binding protein [Promethearchaeota archaeon]
MLHNHILDFVKNKRAIQREYGKVPYSRVDFPNAIRLLDLCNSSIKVPNINISPTQDIAVYITTAGSTGEPKICELTHFNLIANAKQCRSWLGGEDPRIGNLGIIPLFHPFGMTCIMNTTIALGGLMLLFPTQPSNEQLIIEIHNAYAPKGFLFFGPEILFKKINKAISSNDYIDIWEKIKYGIATASPLHTSVQKEFLNKLGGKLVESYGLTEASPVISIGNLINETRENCLGLPLPGTEWGIYDPINFDIGPIDKYGKDNIGEICVSGPQVMIGYLESLKATQDALKKFNNKIWLRTGDLGYMNEDGTIILTERKQEEKKKVKIGASYLVDVEKFVLQHKNVIDTAVLGIPPVNDEPGKITKIWVSLKSEQISNTAAKKFHNWLEKNMPEYKLDTDIEFIKPPSISKVKPETKSVLGKIQKGSAKVGKLPEAKIQK